MKIKKVNDFLTEAHKEGQKDQSEFICKVFGDKELMEVFTDKDIQHVYDYVEDVLKKHDLYEDGVGLKKK